MSPLCRAVRAWAYSCRQSETIHAAVTNRNTAGPGLSANPVQVAQPVTAVTATIPMKTGLILRSLRREAVVVMRWGSWGGLGGVRSTVPVVCEERPADGQRFLTLATLQAIPLRSCRDD